MLTSGMMKTFLLLIWAVISLAAGQSSKDLLRDGLFAEESEGDLKTATEKYEALLKSFEKERKVAAVALYRLAAVKRKEDDEKGALSLYENFSRKFADIEPQATLVRENYLAISGKELPGPGAAFNEDDQELVRIKKLALTSPDLFPNLSNFADHVTKGSTQVISFLLEKGADPNHQGALEAATISGNLSMVKILLDAGADPNHKDNQLAIGRAIEKGHWKVADLLGKKGAKLSLSWPGILREEQIMDLPQERLKFILSCGADPNYISPNWNKNNDDWIGIPIHDAVRLGKHDYLKFLLDSGAKVDLARPTDGVRALHLACWKGDEKMIQILITAGADLNAPTSTAQKQDDPSDRKGFPKRYPIASRPIEPVHAIAIEKASILVEAGAKLTPGLLVSAVGTKNTELVDYFLSKGLDVNGRIEISDIYKSLPLNLAFANQDHEMINHLVSKGANLSNVDWSLLWPEHRIEAARKSKYPKLVEEGKVALVFPEISSFAEHIAKVTPGSGLATELLNSYLPARFTSNGREFTIDYDRLSWNLVRSGKISKMDLQNSKISELKAGDIIEIIGFGEMAKFSNFQLGRLTTIKDINCKFTTQLRKANRFPIKITSDGVTHDVWLCPDKVTFDARGDELPSGNLGQLMTLVMKNTSDVVFDVSVTRSGFSKFTFSSYQSALNGFELQSGDHIQITYPGGDQKRAHYRKTTITARVPGKLGEWRWKVFQNEGVEPLNPSLLAVIADINSGYDIDDTPVRTGAFHSLQTNDVRKVLPGINLAKIVIKRLEGSDEINIEVNLAAKIEQWVKEEGRKRPFDFQLQPGDMIEFSTDEGDWKGFTKETNEYFETALNFPLILVKPGSTRALSVNLKIPEWQHLEWGYFPVEYKGTISSIRGDWIVTDPFHLKRNGKNYHFNSDRRSYWPMAGDIITLENRGPIALPRSRRVPQPPRPGTSRSRTSTPLEVWPKTPSPK